MDLGDLETTIKVIVVGNGRVGKSSMTTRYCKNIYTDSYKKTIGVDFMERVLELDDFGESVRLMIWDTAGQEEFDSLTSRYYKGAGAAVLVFSTVDRDSFDALASWKRKVEDECGPISMALVQNKIDLIDDAVMSSEEVESMARSLGLRLYRACVKDDVNVTEVFEYLTTDYLMRGGDTGGAIASIEDFAAAPKGTEQATTPAHAGSDRDKESPGPSTPAVSSPDDVAGAASPPRSITSPGGRSTAATPRAPRSRHRRPDAAAGTIKLGVSKVRTGNKKKRLCAIL